MKVLLLGVTGRVGSRMLPALVAHKHKVVAYVRSPSKISAEASSALEATVVCSATDSNGIKEAILSHNCDAVVNAAGIAAMTSLHAKTDFPEIFAAVVKGIASARQERGGAPVRCWFLSGWGLMNSPKEPYLLLDYIPLYPDHKINYDLIKTQSPENLAWSLFCASNMPPKFDPPKFPHPPEASNQLISKADSPPGWSESLQGVPLIGNYLNIMAQASGYYTPLEYCVEFMAADLEAGLDSEFVGKRMGVKTK